MEETGTKRQPWKLLLGGAAGVAAVAVGSLLLAPSRQTAGTLSAAAAKHPAAPSRMAAPAPVTATESIVQVDSANGAPLRFATGMTVRPTPAKSESSPASTRNSKLETQK